MHIHPPACSIWICTLSFADNVSAYVITLMFTLKSSIKKQMFMSAGGGEWQVVTVYQAFNLKGRFTLIQWYSVWICRACALIYSKFPSATEVKPLPLGLQPYGHTYTHSHTQKIPQIESLRQLLGLRGRSVAVLQVTPTPANKKKKSYFLMPASTSDAAYLYHLHCSVL